MFLLFGWWFGTFFIFPYIWNSNPNWLIFFRGVQTTNSHQPVMEIYGSWWFSFGGAWTPEPTGVQLDGILWNSKKLSDIHHHVPTFFSWFETFPVFFLSLSPQIRTTAPPEAGASGSPKSMLRCWRWRRSCTALAWHDARPGEIQGTLECWGAERWYITIE